MTTINLETITQAVREAFSHRDSRRDVLAQRIRDLAEQAMDAAGVRSIDLPDPDGDAGKTGGMLAYRTPVGDCSQWADRVEHPGHRGSPCLMLGEPLRGPVGGGVLRRGWRSLGPVPDVSFFDGSNMQHQRGPTRDRETGLPIRPATVAQLRAVARVLPGVLAELLSETCDRAQREAAEADVAIEGL